MNDVRQQRVVTAKQTFAVASAKMQSSDCTIKTSHFRSTHSDILFSFFRFNDS